MACAAQSGPGRGLHLWVRLQSFVVTLISRIAAWFATFAPRGLHEDIRKRLDTEIAAIVASPEFHAFLARTHADPVPLGGAAFEAFVASETEYWRRFAEATGFRID